MQYSNNSNTLSFKPCNWCRKANPNGETPDHEIKNCPVLATVECNYCHQFGHTTKNCDVLKQKRYDQRNAQPKACIECDDEGKHSIRGKFARHSHQNVEKSAIKTSNAFNFALPDSKSGDRFECEKCGFQHSCEEIVEEHEKTCFGSTKIKSSFNWADCDSDEEFDLEDLDAFPCLK